jgi:hypothetical protein
MSYIEEDDIDDEIVIERVVLDEGRERRDAQEAISYALMSATPTLENRGVKHRMLPGLWYAAINVLLATLEADDIVALLNDRIRIVQGSAENADAAPRAFGETAMREYIEEVVLAGDAIMEALEEAQTKLEEANIEDRFPETVFDTALRVLVPSWGPDHVRRAIREQASQFFQGQFEPVNFMEPSRILDPAAAKRRAAAVAATREQAPSQTSKTEPAPVPSVPFEFQARGHRDRRVRIFVGSDVVEGGIGVWAYAMTITDDGGRYEFRKAGGRMKDPTGSRIALAALHEACLAVAALKGRSTVAVESTDEALVRAINCGEDTAVRRPEDGPTWAEIDHVTAAHDTSPRLVAAALSDPLQESCDHLIRDLSRSKGAAR